MLIKLDTIKKRTIVIGKQERETAMINLNKKLRGDYIPHRCTCPINHGWH
jgi:hypothetical protein